MADKKESPEIRYRISGLFFAERRSLSASLQERLFTGNNRFLRAGAGTSAAVYAGIGIDRVNVAGADSTYGASIRASTASDAFVGNFVSHVCFV